ncbi:AraC family transcriptional regulator [Krasilnikovia cinnamomea]|uniref:AraC family transcriptional regulator n=1 Tax=Krasilnikovia cinnamomea TaxID=349313 RepID=A0A4Q7ZM21_9ACTN|nr:helix-turn-helix transcriptional regulator [Krasilnikovia cinnamomea]RZU51664.1 AraC family transcriptional regulator [Krasilnikovia cinnamomea]
MNADEPHTISVELTDADAIETLLSDAYSSMRVRSSDPPLLRYQRVDAGPFALDSLEQSAVLDVRVEPLQAIVVDRTTTARVDARRGGETSRYDTGELFLAALPDQPYAARVMPGRIDACVLDLGLITRVAAAAPGRRPEPIRFISPDPLSPAVAAHWWSTHRYVAELLNNPEAAASPLIVGSAARQLAAATLAAFPNTALTHPTIEDRHDASTVTLRRAVAYIDEHLADDISAAEIAAAAHVSIRALQLAFRRHLGMPPMAYLRRARLHQAHQDLLAADPATTTIGAVAARWGFANHSRFTALYRKTYGVTPQTTLRND